MKFLNLLLIEIKGDSASKAIVENFSLLLEVFVWIGESDPPHNKDRLEDNRIPDEHLPYREELEFGTTKKRFHTFEKKNQIIFLKRRNILRLVPNVAWLNQHFVFLS